MDSKLLKRRAIGFFILFFMCGTSVFYRDNTIILNEDLKSIVIIVFFPITFLGLLYAFLRERFKPSEIRFSRPFLTTLLMNNRKEVVTCLIVGAFTPFFINYWLLGFIMDVFNNNPYQIEARVTRLNNRPETFCNCSVDFTGVSNFSSGICIDKKYGLPSIEVSDNLKEEDKVILYVRESYIGTVVDKVKKIPSQ